MSKINLFDIGLNDRYLQEAAMNEESLFIARVSAQHRELYDVITEKGEIHAEVSGKLSYAANSALEYPAVGDWVLVDRTEEVGGNAIIRHILSRRSCFARKAAGTGQELQIVAVNIDSVLICMSLNSDFNLRRVERYLSIAWDSMATPVIVLTKADLCADISIKLQEIESVAPGVDVVLTSCLSGEGYHDIMKYFGAGKTVTLIGSSGVGKSTLINCLLGADALATAEIRGDDRGRHTTTHRQMIILPDGGVVIDTPGMRELQLAGADFSKSFADIEELALGCYFSDCKHESEPKCSVQEAVKNGSISLERLENYKKLQKEMRFEESKTIMTAAQAEKKKIIEMMGTLKKKQLLKDSRKNKGNR